MSKIITLALSFFTLAACTLPFTPNIRTGTPFTRFSATDLAVSTHIPACYFNWATQTLSELSAQVQAAMDTAGLTGITAHAEAYGENCYDSQTNSLVFFVAMETDFRIAVVVNVLTDKTYLGNLLERILIVLDRFPTGVTPGLNPGHIGVTFHAGKEELNLWFTVADRDSVRARGTNGAALSEALQNK